jgi:hypothetical protein
MHTDRILGAIRGMEPEGFATTLCSGMMSDVGAVCGRMGIVVDRWYHHLLVLLLVFVLSLSSCAFTLQIVPCSLWRSFECTQRRLSSRTHVTRGRETCARRSVFAPA